MLTPIQLLRSIRRQPLPGKCWRYDRKDRIRNFDPRVYHDVDSMGSSCRQICKKSWSEGAEPSLTTSSFLSKSSAIPTTYRTTASFIGELGCQFIRALHLGCWACILTQSFSGSTVGITALSFIIAEAIPFFSYLIGLIGSLCCAPTCVSLNSLFEVLDKLADYAASAHHSGIHGSLHDPWHLP
jgi:hypothetical protein